MEENIMVTIGCISYNQEKYIAQAIESFLMQKTNFKYEILIHDDASTDNTANIIKSYEKKYPNIIKAIYQKENQYSKGIMTSQIVRNRAKGKYIAFCEGDDYWTDENKIQKQFEFLEKNKDYIATGHWCKVVDENNNISSEFKDSEKIFNFNKSEYKLSDYKRNIIPGHINTIMHRNIFLNSNRKYSKIYESSRLVGDRTTYLILILLGKINVEHEFRSAYRYITNNGVSYSSRVKNKNRNYQWFEYYSNLEKNVYKIMGKEVDLKRLKYQHLIMAIIEWIKNPNKKNKEVIKNIVRKANKKEMTLYFPFAILNKFEFYLRYK